MKKTLFLLLASCFLFVAAPIRAADEAKALAPTFTLGKATAPITIDDYASLGCSHCADFHLNTLPQLKATYIDTGKVKIVFHHFPLDQASVNAALLVQCVPSAQGWDVINLLYKEQASWGHDPNYQSKLIGYGAMLGLSAKTVRACLDNSQMRTAILQGRMDASAKLQIDSTPTFILNGGAARLEGFQTFDQMAAVLNKM